MDHDADKLWLQQSLNQVAVARAADAIQKLGSALPCRVVEVTGSLVTVAFEVDSAPWVLPQITIPKLESQWIRTPTQIGDFGLTIPADAFLSNVSGGGGGLPGLQQPGNLGALAWLPVASSGFPGVNINAAYVAGPQGAVIGTSDGNTVITANEAGVTITAAGKTWTFGSAGFTMANAVVAETHIHDQGVDSHGDTEQPTGGPITP